MIIYMQIDTKERVLITPLSVISLPKCRCESAECHREMGDHEYELRS